MIRSFVYKAASVATLSFVAAATAHAQFANNLNVVGQAQISSPGMGAGQPLNIDFLSGATFAPSTPGIGTPGNVFSGFANGFFGSIANGSRGTIQDLTVSANGTSTTTNPGGNAATFMTIGGDTFTLGSAPAGSLFGPISLNDSPGGAVASFSIFGTVMGANIATPTTYQGLFTAQFVGESAATVFTQINNGGSPIVTFSANFGAPVGTTVPEPSTYALMVAGMGALGLVARRRRSNA